jgi:hypothetical protein
MTSAGDNEPICVGSCCSGLQFALEDLLNRFKPVSTEDC